MTADPITLLVAAGVPIIALITVVGLVVGLRQLERSRDELADLNLMGRR